MRKRGTETPGVCAVFGTKRSRKPLVTLPLGTCQSMNLPPPPGSPTHHGPKGRSHNLPQWLFAAPSVPSLPQLWERQAGLPAQGVRSGRHRTDIYYDSTELILADKKNCIKSTERTTSIIIWSFVIINSLK